MMSFTEFLTKKGLSEENIEDILIFFKKLPPDSNSNLKLAAEYLLYQTGGIPQRISKRSQRKIEVLRKFNELSTRCSRMKKSEKVKTIAHELGVKPDCIYVYLREMEVE